jgi:hypothetical protein
MRAFDEKNMNIMATLKAMPNLITLEMAYHSSHEVKLEKDLFPWIYRAIIITQVPVFRISATTKCMKVDGTRIHALLNRLDNFLDCTKVNHHPLRYDPPNAQRILWEWTGGAEASFYIEAARPNAEYQQNLRNALMFDRAPILGMAALDDEDDEMLTQFPDPEGRDNLAYGLEVLDPKTYKFLNRTMMERCKDRVRDGVRKAHGRIEERIAETSLDVEKGVRTSVKKVRKLLKGLKKPNPMAEHGRVRHIVPGLNCDCSVCANEMNN